MHAHVNRSDYIKEPAAVFVGALIGAMAVGFDFLIVAVPASAGLAGVAFLIKLASAHHHNGGSHHNGDHQPCLARGK